MATAEIQTPQATLTTLLRMRGTYAVGLIWASVMLVLLALLLGAKDIEFEAPALIVCYLLAAIALAMGIWQLAPVGPKVLTDEELIDRGLRQRQTVSIALLLGSLLILLLAVLIFSRYGMAAFGEVGGMALFALIGLGAGLALQRKPGGTSFQDRLLEGLLQNRQGVTYGLLFGGALFMVIAIWRFLAGDLKYLGAAALAVSYVAAGIWQLATPPENVTVHTMRRLVLFVGGITGLIVALVTALQIDAFWGTHIAGGLQSWHGEESWRVWACIYIGLLSLALIFASVLLAQTDIRTSAPMRRLLYGYNAVLNGLLWIALLIIVNIVIFVNFPFTFEWSQTHGLHSLSAKSKNLLDSLKEPVTVYVLLAEHHKIHSEVKTLLDNCQAYSRNIRVKQVSPDRDPKAYRDLKEQYPAIAADAATFRGEEQDVGRGLLITYGPDSGEKLPNAFIPQANLSDRQHDITDRTGKRFSYLFKGEDVIMTQIRILADKETKPKIYFTQSNRELDIENAIPRPIDLAEPRIFLDVAEGRAVVPTGIGKLLDRLKKDNYDVSGLLWETKPKRSPAPNMTYSRNLPDDKHQVPDDAKVVVLVSPFTPLGKEVREALERFVDRNGRLFVLTNPNIGRDLRLVDTDLEEMLKKYNVQIGKGFLLRFAEGEFPWTVVAVTPGESRNLIAKNFRQNRFELVLARKVEPIQGQTASYHAETILQVQAIPNRKFWEEPDPKIFRGLGAHLRNLERTGELDTKASPTAIPVGVAVADREQKPKMVVLGDGYLADNVRMGQSSTYYDLMTSCIEWLVERPGNMGISPRESKTFSIRADDVHPGRMRWVPLGLAMLGFFGLGTGIWVIRRR